MISACLTFRSTRLLRASTFMPSAAGKEARFRSTRLLRASTITQTCRSSWREFRSTRLLRASTPESLKIQDNTVISIHEALASLDRLLHIVRREPTNFDPRGSCEPRQRLSQKRFSAGYFDPRGSCEPRQGCRKSVFQPGISIHEALASLDHIFHIQSQLLHNFDPRGSCEPRPPTDTFPSICTAISIHEALASLDYHAISFVGRNRKFRSTRLLRASTASMSFFNFSELFRSTRLLRASTKAKDFSSRAKDFDPRGSCEPRRRNA